MKRCLTLMLSAACLLCAGCIAIGNSSYGTPPAAPPRPAVTPLVGSPAPALSAPAVMPGGRVKTIDLEDYRGDYVVVFFYPADFSLVCPTEIVGFDARLEEFEDVDAHVIGVSTDTHFAHLAYRAKAPSAGGIGQIGFPLVADTTREVSRAFRVLNADGLALRGVFIIDKKGVLRCAAVNGPNVGRDVGEVLRTLKAVRFVDEMGQMCGEGWQPGEAGLVPH